MATGEQQAQPRSLYEFGEAWMLQSVAQARGSAVAPAVLLSSSAHSVTVHMQPARLVIVHMQTA
jgi:hypothetical protein